MITHVIYDAARAWGSIEVRIVNGPAFPEHVEFVTIAKPGHTAGAIRFTNEESGRLWEALRRYDELCNGHPRHRARRET